MGRALNDLAKTIGDALGSIVWGWVVIVCVFLVVGFFVLRLFLGGGGSSGAPPGFYPGTMPPQMPYPMYRPSAPPLQQMYAPQQIPQQLPMQQSFTPRGVYGKL